jgi:YD repeat-containing protein
MTVGNTDDVVLRRGNQRASYFSSSSQFSTTADIRDRITPILAVDGSRSGWAVKNGDTEAIETYNADGYLISSTALNRQTTTFAYSDATTPANVAPRAGLLLQVTDAFGAALSFSYDTQGRLAQMSDPAGGIYAYVYDAENRLQSVTYPGGKHIEYLYNETGMASPQMPTALTGIIDENGSRYATFTYKGYEAVTTEHAGGVNKYSLSSEYSTQTSVTDPLGTIHYYNFSDTLFGIKRYTGEQQPRPTGSGSVTKSITYDANANVASVTDFNGSKTTYTWNLTRNLETSRIDGAGTTAARTISTEWHPTLELRTRIAEPKRLTVYTYDENGNLLSQTVRATTDVNGTTGFNATLTGTPQTWTYTYNAQGQRLTAKGPRNDINDTTRYTYDMAGNLTSITNGAGHITTLSDYDPHGHVGKITAANGLETTFSYTPRGWLSSSNVGGETTSYTYDGVGQLTGVTLPDNSTVSYTYDPAHRLTAISDSAGNSIAYTLDNMGNRTGEQVKDATGALARQISRAYDPLNKLKTVTGAAQ